MNKTHLIQRVTEPRNGGLGIRNPFSFGAGGGCLSNEALDLLSPVLNFDYMMAAEYEFGAVPESLNKIYQLAKNNNLGITTLDIPLKGIKNLKYGYKDWTPRTTPLPVYIICSKSDQEEIRRRVCLLGTDEDKCMADMGLHDGMSVRDSPGLNRALKYEFKYDRPVVGWLELDNGFFFTVNPAMAEKFAALFGISVELKTAKNWTAG